MKTDRELLAEAAGRILANDPTTAERLRGHEGDPGLQEMVGNFRLAVKGPVLESMEESRNFALETIVNRYGRPVLLVERNDFRLEGAETAIWGDRLGQQSVKQAIALVIPAVGRIEVQNMEMDWLGTGWLVAEDVVVTNRHVAFAFGMRGAGTNAGFVFRRGQLDDTRKMTARIDFREEHGSSESSEFRVLDILHIEDENGPDVAFLKVERRNQAASDLAQPLRLSAASASKDQYVGTVGYPAADSRVPDYELVRRLFGDVYNVKRFAPGQILTGTSDEVTHNCSTLGGNSGSPIFDLATGVVVGLHYSGLFLRANYGVSAAVLAARLAQVRRGPIFAIGGVVAPGESTGASAAFPQQPPPPPAPGTSTSDSGPSGPVTLNLNVPLQITITLGQPMLQGGAVAAVAAVASSTSASEALRQAKELVGENPAVLSVRSGYAFRNGWITDQPAVVVVLRDSRARPGLKLPEAIGPFPVEIRDPGPVDFVPAGGLLTEAIRETAYKKPSDFSLKKMKGKMSVICHVSPDAGWPVLKDFLGGTQKRLTIGMYDFSAPHIVDAVTDAVRPAPRTLELVLEDLKDAVGGSGIKKDDLPDVETEAHIRKAIGDRLTYASASVGTGRQFASAYHIKVAVRDGTAFWLSSGNWQSSNQHAAKVDPAKWWALSNLNREWHIVIENEDLATQFEKYLRYDLTNARAEESRPVAEGIEVLVSEALDEERVPAEDPTYFEPLSVDREIKVLPLLTPDNYQKEVLALIKCAEEQILFQNQSFSLLYDDKKDIDTNDARFAALADALLAKQQEGLDVRIIIRGDFNPQTPIERLKQRGFDMARVRLQNHCHTKGMIVDNKRVLVGSHNWTNEGALVNRDASLIFDDEEIARYFAQVFWFDWKKLSRASVGQARRVQPVDANEATFGMPDGMVRVPLTSLFD